MTDNSEVDRDVKYNVLKDTFHLLNLSAQTRRKYRRETWVNHQQRVMGQPVTNPVRGNLMGAKFVGVNGAKFVGAGAAVAIGKALQKVAVEKESAVGGKVGGKAVQKVAVGKESAVGGKVGGKAVQKVAVEKGAIGKALQKVAVEKESAVGGKVGEGGRRSARQCRPQKVAVEKGGAVGGKVGG